MRLEEFRQMVRKEFGESLQNATPANVREFIDRVELASGTSKIGQRIVIDETSTSYEEIIKDFFAQVLEMPAEEAVVGLWLLAVDITFSGIESQYADKLASLFEECD